MSEHPDKNSYLSLQDLQAKGWSRRLISRYLGDPDRVAVTSQSLSGRPSSLYCAKRVRAVSTRPDLAKEFAQVQTFVIRNQRVANERFENMRSAVVAMALPDLRHDISTVLCNVRRQYPWVTSFAEEHRLAVENLLGTLELSVDALETFSWHAGVCEARKLLEKRMLAHISETYPLLAHAVSLKEAEPSG
jgi:hypothetical protein